MCDLNGFPITTYDSELKIWSGGSEQSYFNDDLTVGQIIFKQLQREPQRIFQISHTENTRLTRRQMLQNAAKVSCYLRANNFITTTIETTDIVGIMARNSTHLAAMAYGCLFNGTPFHAVNPNIETKIVSNLFTITKPRIICCDAKDYRKVNDIAKSLDAQVIIIDGEVEGITNILDLLQVKLSESYEPTKFDRGIDRTMAILCSSGTTGTPKAVTISNSRKLFEAYSYLTADDVQYAPSTLDWLTGLLSLVTAGVYGTVRLISKEIFSTAHFLDMCDQHGITWTVLASSHVAMLANAPDLQARQLLSLRHLLFAGGHCLVGTLEKMQSFLQAKGILRNAYGFTELGTVASSNYNVDSKPTSVGRLMANIRMRVVDGEGRNLGPKETGELFCHNGQTWQGYYGNPKATSEIQDPAGWFHTGDVGYFDDDNYLYIVERKKDMLKYLGMMYYPHEVEEVIAQMRNVAEVCVFGIWNETEGDAAAAAIVAKPGSQLLASQVQEFVRNNIPVQYKQLNGGIQIVQQLAKSANGKVNRQAVKAAYLNESQRCNLTSKQ